MQPSVRPLPACTYLAYHEQESPDIIIIIIVIVIIITITITAIVIVVIINIVIFNVIVILIIIYMQTPRAPPLPVAAFLSPILWRLNNPDKFDMYSVGVLFLQMVFPNLRR